MNTVHVIILIESTCIHEVSMYVQLIVTYKVLPKDKNSSDSYSSMKFSSVCHLCFPYN